MGADTGMVWIPTICCVPGTLRAHHIHILIHPSPPLMQRLLSSPSRCSTTEAQRREVTDFGSHSQQAADDNVPPDSQGRARDDGGQRSEHLLLTRQTWLPRPPPPSPASSSCPELASAAPTYFFDFREEPGTWYPGLHLYLQNDPTLCLLSRHRAVCRSALGTGGGARHMSSHRASGKDHSPSSIQVRRLLLPAGHREAVLVEAAGGEALLGQPVHVLPGLRST